MQDQNTDRTDNKKEPFNDKKIIEKLSEYGTKLEVEDGKLICIEGDWANDAFIVDNGKFNVFKKFGERKMPLATLAKGDIFGEIALFANSKRTASVRAFGKGQVIKISKEDLERVIHDDPEIGLFFLHLISTRLYVLTGQLYKYCKESKMELAKFSGFYTSARSRSRLIYMR